MQFRPGPPLHGMPAFARPPFMNGSLAMPPGVLELHQTWLFHDLSHLICTFLFALGLPPPHLMRPPLMMPPPAGPVVLTPPGMTDQHSASRLQLLLCKVVT